jgi:hypothetical protein
VCAAITLYPPLTVFTSHSSANFSLFALSILELFLASGSLDSLTPNSHGLQFPVLVSRYPGTNLNKHITLFLLLILLGSRLETLVHCPMLDWVRFQVPLPLLVRMVELTQNFGQTHHTLRTLHTPINPYNLRTITTILIKLPTLAHPLEHQVPPLQYRIIVSHTNAKYAHARLKNVIN